LFATDPSETVGIALGARRESSVASDTGERLRFDACARVWTTGRPETTEPSKKGPYPSSELLSTSSRGGLGLESVFPGPLERGGEPGAPETWEKTIIVRLEPENDRLNSTR